MKAVRKLVFTIVKDCLGINPLPLDYDILGAQADLRPVLEWMSRGMRLHQVDSDTMEVNLKLDGRPFWGNFYDQVYQYINISSALWVIK